MSTSVFCSFEILFKPYQVLQKLQKIFIIKNLTANVYSNYNKFEVVWRGRSCLIYYTLDGIIQWSVKVGCFNSVYQNGVGDVVVQIDACQGHVRDANILK